MGREVVEGGIWWRGFSEHKLKDIKHILFLSMSPPAWDLDTGAQRHAGSINDITSPCVPEPGWRWVLPSCFIYPRFYGPRYGRFSQYQTITVSLFIISHLAFLNSFLSLEILCHGHTQSLMKRVDSYTFEAMPQHCTQPQILYWSGSTPESQFSDACPHVSSRSPKRACQLWRRFLQF